MISWHDHRIRHFPRIAPCYLVLTPNCRSHATVKWRHFKPLTLSFPFSHFHPQSSNYSLLCRRSSTKEWRIIASSSWIMKLYHLIRLRIKSNNIWNNCTISPVPNSKCRTLLMYAQLHNSFLTWSPRQPLTWVEPTIRLANHHLGLVSHLVSHSLGLSQPSAWLTTTLAWPN